jgi:hypothetical protein
VIDSHPAEVLARPELVAASCRERPSQSATLRRQRRYRYAGCSSAGSASTASRRRSAISRLIDSRDAPIPAQCGSMPAATHHVRSDGQTNAGVPPRENSGRPQISASAGGPQISAEQEVGAGWDLSAAGNCEGGPPLSRLREPPALPQTEIAIVRMSGVSGE